MRRLIVNADDFGLSEGVNAGIVRAHRRGHRHERESHGPAAGRGGSRQRCTRLPGSVGGTACRPRRMGAAGRRLARSLRLGRRLGCSCGRRRSRTAADRVPRSGRTRPDSSRLAPARPSGRANAIDPEERGPEPGCASPPPLADPLLRRLLRPDERRLSTFGRDRTRRPRGAGRGAPQRDDGALLPSGRAHRPRLGLRGRTNDRARVTLPLERASRSRGAWRPARESFDAGGLTFGD